MKCIVYSSPFIPAEWIAAHELKPLRIVPRAASRAAIPAGMGVCPFARAFANEVLADAEAAGAIFATTCDQMRRLAEQTAAAGPANRIFLFNVPATWQSVTAQKIYLAELQRLGRWLETRGGAAPSRERLAETMVQATLPTALEKAASNRQAPALAVVGGPLLAEHRGIFDLIQHAGGRIVLDAAEGGERTRRAAWNRRSVREEPLLALADAYFGHIPDAFRRPNSELYAWLKRELAARQVHGIVFLHYIWCDLWRAEAQRLKEWCGLPVLVVELGDQAHFNAHVRSRIASFLEMLK